jgi:signal transduction histidine kinase
VYQSVDDIRLYERDRDGGDGWRERQFGRALPFHTRAIPHKSFYLPLASPDGGGPVVYHLRLRTADTLQLDLRLLAPEALAASVGASRLVAGLYFGVMGALALYNLLLFLCLRDRAYLYYVGFQVALGSLQAALDQLTFQLLWPEHPVWSAWSETLFVGLTLFCAAAFARHFLATPRGRAPWPGVLVAIQATSLALALACPLTSKVEFVIAAMVFVGLACLLLLAAGVVAWRRGVTNARFFVIAWAALLGGTVLVSLTATGVLSTTGIAQESTRLGSALEAVLLSLGLAHRINHMRRENERIQADLVRVRTEEAERLDRTVQERTRDLLGTLAELRRAQGQLVQQARLAALGHLVSGVIHEVGNPLNFIHGGTEDLVRRLDQVSDCLAAAARGGDRRADTIAEAEQTIAGAFTAAELIGNGNRRIGQIVENLRGFVSGRPAVQEPTDVADVIRRTAALMRPTLDPRGIALSLALEDLPEIVSSPGEIGQVLMNLMLNAAQAMPAGGSLHVAGRAVAGSLEIAVEDTGPGVPPGIRDAIFDPFFTTRPPNEGTGLGLSICHEIVSRHGGTLRLDEDHQPGARFVVRVPVPAPPRAIPGAAPGAGRAA